MKQPALILHPNDNVATAVKALTAGDVVNLEQGGTTHSVTLQDTIPFGHKFALTAIAKSAAILKYGEPIGIASADISPGAHVHVHNLESQRGRGDL